MGAIGGFWSRKRKEYGEYATLVWRMIRRGAKLPTKPLEKSRQEQRKASFHLVAQVMEKSKQNRDLENLNGINKTW